MNYYSLMGVSMDATEKEIRAAYFSAAQRDHPDGIPNEDARETFESIKKAYDTLIDPVLRKRYDDSLHQVPDNTLLTFDVSLSRDVILKTHEPQLLYAMLRIHALRLPERFNYRSSHVCLVVDRSTSMQGERINALKFQINDLLDMLKPIDYLSVVSFSDRAEILVPPTLSKDRVIIQSKLAGLKTSGATEIYQGLEMGIRLLRGEDLADNRILILLTDGHTYGDEDSCLSIAKDAGADGITIHTLGIGTDWNDHFLDRLANLAGGTSSYVPNAQSLIPILESKFDTANKVIASSLRIDCLLGEEVECVAMFRVEPEIGELTTNRTVPLGNLSFKHSTSILFEFRIDPSPHPERNIRTLLHGEFNYLNIFKDNKIEAIPVSIRVPVKDKVQQDKPPAFILQAASRINLYRLQQKAREEVDQGQFNEAARHLHQLATHLLARGERDLARTVLREAQEIQETRHYSSSGEKNIKYGTRGLLLLPAPKGGTDDSLS
jgi:Ca-activated chloride channel family protein